MKTLTPYLLAYSIHAGLSAVFDSGGIIIDRFLSTISAIRDSLHKLVPSCVGPLGIFPMDPDCEKW